MTSARLGKKREGCHSGRSGKSEKSAPIRVIRVISVQKNKSNGNQANRLYQMIFELVIFGVFSMKHLLFSMNFQETRMNINSGAKSTYYFVPVGDSSSMILENVKIAFPAKLQKKV